MGIARRKKIRWEKMNKEIKVQVSDTTCLPAGRR
jgi:hypothetical protein